MNSTKIMRMSDTMGMNPLNIPIHQQNIISSVPSSAPCSSIYSCDLGIEGVCTVVDVDMMSKNELKQYYMRKQEEHACEILALERDVQDLLVDAKKHKETTEDLSLRLRGAEADKVILVQHKEKISRRSIQYKNLHLEALKDIVVMEERLFKETMMREQKIEDLKASESWHMWIMFTLMLIILTMVFCIVPAWNPPKDGFIAAWGGILSEQFGGSCCTEVLEDVVCARFRGSVSSPEA